MNKKSLKYLSVIVIFFLGFFAVNAIELNNINTNYSVWDTLWVWWFNNLKSRIKDIYWNWLNVGIGTSTPTQKLDVVWNVNSNWYCINGVCKNSWDPNSPWNISWDNIYFTWGSVGIGIENPAWFLNLEERDAWPNSAWDWASLVIWDVNWVHLELDNNEIHAMNWNSVSTLHLNLEWGNTLVGWNLGVGTNAPEHKLHVTSWNIYSNGEVIGNMYWWYWQFRAVWWNYWMVIRNDWWSTRFLVTNSWNPYWNYNWLRPIQINMPDWRVFFHNTASFSSDIKLKKNLKDISSPIEKIKSLKWYGFEWKANWKKDLWLIAQEVEKVFPEIVSNTKDIDWTNLKAVQYTSLIAPMIEAIKEQQKQIEKLQEEIEMLKKEKK